MVLGSTLTSVSLVLQTLAEAIERERGAIEARIAQGGTRFAAFAPLLRRAMRTATTPLLNIASVAGMVTLPGMMTGPNSGRRRSRRSGQVSDRAGCSSWPALPASAPSPPHLGGILLVSDNRHRLRLDRLAPFG